MRFLRRVLSIPALALCANSVALAFASPAPVWATILSVLVLAIAYLFINLRPLPSSEPTSRTRALGSGSELLLLAECVLVLQVICAAGYPLLADRIGVWSLVINAVVGLVLTGGVVLNGFLRIMAGTRRIRLRKGVLLTCLWWVPLVGVIPMERLRRTAREESELVTAAIERDQTRRESQICATRYPILMVHGIFFRDWKHFGYWGRIPDALTRNGAAIHYGSQQSSSSIEDSAAELRDSVLKLCAETGAEKVNIIAHSKGGLDARFAISRQGLGDRVASLTTINTPHLGTVLAGSLIARTPEKLVLAVGKQYDALFAKLGDDQPDFLSGINGLTPQACAALNEQVLDDPRVLYQSCGSVMRGPGSAPFPLNLGYQLIRPQAGENDGLVDAKSMVWGEFRGVARGTEGVGVSHGDMIDLLCRDIPGFDVCEFYVQLVAELRQRGL